MSNDVKPWSTHRQALWALGVLQLFFLAGGVLLAWILHGGFGPGKLGRAPGLADLIGAAVLATPSVYYIAAACSVWTRRTRLIDILIHSLVLVLLFIGLGLFGADGLVVFSSVPFLLIGALVWILYATRNRFCGDSTR